MNNNPIGVFDSGIGGLNVLKSLIEELPNEDFIYVADTLNCPYGVKTKEEIKGYVDGISSYLINQKCKAIVIACNTATAQATHLFDLEDVLVLGVIYPTANDALNGSKKVAVLATDSTISSGVYQEILLDAGKEVYPVKASLFVEPIERGEIGTSYSYELVRNHLAHLVDKDIDTVIAGCTHFALYEKEIQTALPSARVVNSGPATSKELHKLLQKRNLLSSKSEGKVYLKTTLSEDALLEQVKIFDLKYESIKKINI